MEIKQAEKNGFYVEGGEENGRIHSRYDPVREARRRLPDQDAESSRYVVLGAGLGYVLDLLADFDPGAEVLLVEPNPDLLNRGAQRGIWSSDQLDSYQVITPTTSDLTGALGSFLTLEHHRDFEVVHWSQYENQFAEFFHEVLEAISHVQSLHRGSIDVLATQGETWLKHARMNLKHLYSHTVPSPESLDQTLALVSAGPSLDDQVQWLDAHRDELVVICGNTSGPAIRRRGISADAHAAVDANVPVLSDLQDSRVNNLFFSPFVSPKAVEEVRGHRTLLGVITPLTEWLASAEFLPSVHPGGAISATMLSWLTEQTEHRVFLLGCDMEFRGGRYYAHGTLREREALHNLSRFQTLPGWHYGKYEEGHDQHTLGQERDWFIERSRESQQLVVPGSPPSWWEGEVDVVTESSKATELAYHKPDPTRIRDWAQEHHQHLNRLINGRSVPEEWASFEHWVTKITDEPAVEFQEWTDTFQLLAETSST